MCIRDSFQPTGYSFSHCGYLCYFIGSGILHNRGMGRTPAKEIESMASYLFHSRTLLRYGRNCPDGTYSSSYPFTRPCTYDNRTDRHYLNVHPCRLGGMDLFQRDSSGKSSFQQVQHFCMVYLAYPLLHRYIPVSYTHLMYMVHIGS